MHPDDEKRLQREIDIAKAVRGPDYSMLERDLKAVRDEVFKRVAMSRADYQRQQTGYYQEPYAPRDPQGQTLPFRGDPTLER